MATNKNSFTAYCDWGNVFDELTDEQLGKLTRHIWDYVRDKNPETDDQTVRLLFIPIRDALKRDLKKWEKRCELNREVGKKGGRPKKTDNPKNPMGYLETERLISKPKKPDNDNDSDSDINIIADEFLNEVKSGQHKMMIEGWKMNLKIDGFALQKLLTEFRTHLITDNIKHSNTLEFRRHFKNWLNALDAKGKLNEYKTQRIGSL
jgi:hypothetical protein